MIKIITIFITSVGMIFGILWTTLTLIDSSADDLMPLVGVTFAGMSYLLGYSAITFFNGIVRGWNIVFYMVCIVMLTLTVYCSIANVISCYKSLMKPNGRY